MTQGVKTCFKCLRTLDVSEFYKHPAMKDGRLGKCKECTKADTIANRIEKIEHYRSYDKLRASAPHRVKARKDYAKTDAGEIAHKRAKAKWIANNPEKRKAECAVSNAIKSGKVIKEPCFVCGSENVEAHHPDYSSPLSVVWLCVSHHKEIHWNMKEAA